MHKVTFSCIASVCVCVCVYARECMLNSVGRQGVRVKDRWSLSGDVPPLFHSLHLSSVTSPESYLVCFVVVAVAVFFRFSFGLFLSCLQHLFISKVQTWILAHFIFFKPFVLLPSGVSSAFLSVLFLLKKIFS